MGQSEIEQAEHDAEVNYKHLLEVDHDLAVTYHESARRLIDIAAGRILPKYQKLLLINGRPARGAKEPAPAA